MHVAREQQNILKHQGEPSAQLSFRDVPKVDSVDGDAALLRVVKPQHQRNDGRLPTAGNAREGHSFADLDIKGHILQSVVVVAGVGKPDMLEANALFKLAEVNRLDRIRQLLLFGQQGKDPFGAGYRLLNRGQLLRHTPDRLKRPPDQNDKQADRADRERARFYPEHTKEQHQADPDRLEEEHRIEKENHGNIHVPILDKLQFVGVVNSLAHVGAAVENLDNRHAVQKLGYRRRQFRHFLADFQKARGGFPLEDVDQQPDTRHNRQEY